jgi:Glycosyltransferase family 87
MATTDTLTARTMRSARSTGSSRLTRGDLIVAAVCLVVVALWTVRGLREAQTSDMGLAWIAGDLTWRTGHPEALFSWTGTPLLAAIMALVSRVMSAKTATDLLGLLNAALAIALVGLLCRRLHRFVSRPWLWVIALGLVSFAPLMSTAWWKQTNLIALALGVAGFDLVRRSGSRSALGPALIGLSVAFKPLLILLPFVLAARRSTRRAGLLAIGWLAGLSMAGLALAAWRAHQFSPLNPWTAISNFSHKSDPRLYGYAYSPDNFSPIAALIKLGGTQHWRLYQVSAVVLVALLGVWTAEALRGRPVTSWEAFAFIAAFSVMISPISWNHYQLLLAPLLVVLVVGMSRAGGSVGDWLGLALAFVLASLVWRPYGTLTGTVHSLFSQGRLPPDNPGSGATVPIEALSQWAQYVLVATGVLWFTRSRSGVSRASE